MYDRLKKPEYIICAAVYYEDGKKYEHQPKNITSGIVIAGRRHHNAIMTMFYLMGEEKIDKKIMKQGFVTSDDRYVDRKEAYKIANKEKQLLIGSFDSDDDCILTSEDLY